MNSVEETRLAEDLRLLAASPPDPPDLGQIERRGAQRRRRGHALRGLAALTGLAVALGTGLAVTGSGRGTPARPPAETVAYVTQRITAALNLNNWLVRTTQNELSGTGEVTYWTDLRTNDSMLSQGRGAARTTYWLEQYFDRQHRVLHWDMTRVNYGPRTWWTHADQAAAPRRGSLTPALGPGEGSLFTPQFIALALKGATIVGHPYVNGHRTVELSAFRLGPKVLLWADASTYQVVRMVADSPASAHVNTIVASFTWAKRSAALVQQVDHPHIPAGFRQVPPGS